jgi:NADPH:quinone reductase-like Zn-dependent oxidoreductase
VNFINELNFERYDYIFLTRALSFDCQFLTKFLISPESLIINCVEPPSYEFESPVMRAFYTIYVKFKLIWSELRGKPLLLDGHILIQQETINRLADYVNDGILQTVIDQVFTAEADHCERAMQHVGENKRIGSTVVTFR